MAALEIWGGIECTLNRVGDVYHSQLALSGHLGRIDDLDAIAAVGIRTLRYPLLWEMLAADGLAKADWRWADERLRRLHELGVEPIAGLVHHGSGPRYATLLDPGFATSLAAYARAVAERFPHLRLYTPINEPLTTARFCGLYGLWHPHERSNASFARAVVNQCRAVVLSMQAVREINPAAQLVQTDDLGKVYSTPRLAYQASFENERRWLAWDLLFGRVSAEHALHGYLLAAGIGADELEWFLCNPCPPDIVGINHYVTSDRFLDHRVARYPERLCGGNAHERYADIEAVRILERPSGGIGELLREAWGRYGRPLAVTEVHLACTREEQLRWLHEVWSAAQTARADGIDVRAVTPWALLGSFDWRSLLTRFDGSYEPGAFDVRGGQPRPTALARAIEALAKGNALPDGSVMGMPGWWRRPQRLLYESAASAPLASWQPRNARSMRPILITGATGTLGRAFARICAFRNLEFRMCERRELDITDAHSVQNVLDSVRPWAVINTAGYVRVDEAERDSEHCYRANVDGARNLAAACAARDLPFVTFSSDLVFDGRSERPYIETDAVQPLNVYGLSKARAEHAVLEAHGRALIIRSSAFFGPWDDHNFLTESLRALARGERVAAPADLIVSPTYVPDLVNAVLDLLLDRAAGLWHCTNQGSLSWIEFAKAAATRAEIPAGGLHSPQPSLQAAERPRFSSMTSTRGLLLPDLNDAIDRYLHACGAQLAA